MQNLTSMGCLKAVWWVQTAPLNCFVPSARTQTTSAQPQVDPNWPANWADFRQPSRAAGFVVGLGKMHNHRFLATALPNRFLKPWPAAENLSGTSCRMHTCAKFWTRNAAVQSVRTPGQVLNPDFEKNMAKNWAEFRQPSRADGFTEGAQLSAQLRAATKGQICACTFSRVLASAPASRTNFRGSSRTVTKNLCWQSCRTHTCAANF